MLIKLYKCVGNVSRGVGNTQNQILTNQILTNHFVNLRDLIAATGLVILPKLDSNRRFFSPCNLEI